MNKMKKFQIPEAFHPFLALMIAFAITHKSIETAFIAPAMAQSSTETSPQTNTAPVQTTEIQDLAWWWLLLPLSAGLLWWVTRSRSTSEITAVEPVAPIAPVVPMVTPTDEPSPEMNLPSSMHQLELEVVPREALASFVSEATIPLLEERLTVNFHRRKIGEVVVRKEIDICIVEVPVRRERLIVEQISPKYEQLAVVDLGSASVRATNSSEEQLPQTAKASFASANAAIAFLESIAVQSTLSPTAPISLMLADESLRSAYQTWLAQHEINAAKR
jgi:Domain of unknown function (DUF2382)